MLRDDEWLDRAKRLPVRGKIRVHHGRERRPNLVIAHDSDKWWAYCQACKTGGVRLKEHVMFTGSAPPPESDVPTPPTDAVLASTSEHAERVGAFLARKGMDYMYLPPVLYSPSRKRIVLDTEWGMLGRDVTDLHPAKWLVYSGYKVLARLTGVPVVVVEDAFSMYKVRYAVRGAYDVVCALGTHVSTNLVLQLMNAPEVIWMMDGDAAGYKGAATGCKRMRAMGVPSRELCAPAELDPKDLSCTDIRALLMGGRV